MDVFYSRGLKKRQPRKSSDVRTRFPIVDTRVPLMLITPWEVIIANGANDKVELLKQFSPEDTNQILLASWPGKQLTDTFVIDDPEPLLKTLALAKEGTP